MAGLSDAAACGPEQRLALGPGQHPSWRIEPLRQTFGQLSRRDQIRNQDRARIRQRARLDAVAQVRGRHASRNDVHAITRVERRAVAGQTNGGVTERSQIPGADQPGYTGSWSFDQCPMLNAECSMLEKCPIALGIELCALSIVPCYCSLGGSRSDRISAWARPSIINAPAAADEASQAAAAL